MRISDWSSDVCSSDLVLHVGRVNEQREYAPVGIHHGMTLAPHHLLAGIIAARAAGFGRLHALAVDDGRRRARLPADAGAVELDQMMVEALEQRIVPQTGHATGRDRECQYVSIPVVAVS